MLMMKKVYFIFFCFQLHPFLITKFQFSINFRIIKVEMNKLNAFNLQTILL
jgi:hypothetical protein